MREVIEKVMAAEAEAKSLLSHAQQEAEALVQQARQHALRIAEQSRKDVRLEAERMVAEAETAALAQKQRQIGQIADALQSGLQLDAADHRHAVKVVVDTLSGSA